MMVSPTCGFYPIIPSWRALNGTHCLFLLEVLMLKGIANHLPLFLDGVYDDPLGSCGMLTQSWECYYSSIPCTRKLWLLSIKHLRIGHSAAQFSRHGTSFNGQTTDTTKQQTYTIMERYLGSPFDLTSVWSVKVFLSATSEKANLFLLDITYVSCTLAREEMSKSCMLPLLWLFPLWYLHKQDRTIMAACMKHWSVIGTTGIATSSCPPHVTHWVHSEA